MRGGTFDESRVLKVFGKALKHAKLSGIGQYDLTHTYATLLMGKGVPINYVSRQLGHERPTTTLQWYVDALPSEDAGSNT